MIAFSEFFFHINFHYQELMVIFAKYDDFIIKHTDSMYQNAVYGKCIVFTGTFIFFLKIHIDEAGV